MLTSNYYELLGVEPTIPQNEIRRAYFKALKSYPVDKHPDKHQEVRKAYDILGDPQKRKDYDLERENAGEIGELLTEGQELFEQERYSEAITLLKKAVVLSPTQAAEKLLIQCNLKLGKLENAIKILNVLLERNKEDIDLYESMGYSLLVYLIEETSNDHTQMTQEHKKSLILLQDIFDTCIQINPEAREGYMGNARVQLYLQKYDICENWCQKAIDCDDQHDFDDFDSFILKLETLIIQNKNELLESETRYLLTLVPDEEGYKDYSRGRLIDLALTCRNQRFFIASGNILKIVNEEMNDPEIAEVVSDSYVLDKANNELNLLLEDDDAYAELKKLGLWSLWTFMDINEEEREKIFQEAISELDNVQRSGGNEVIKQSLASYRLRYPNLYQIQKKFWDLMDEEVANEGCGCLLIGVLIPLVYFLNQSVQYIFS